MGPLLIVGGADKSHQHDIYESFIENCLTHINKKPHVAVLATASTDPEAEFSQIEPKLKKAGAGKILLIEISNSNKDWQEGAWNQDVLDFLRTSDGFWFTGGDQSLTLKTLLTPDNKDTPALKIIKERNEEGAVIGGTSGGVAIMSDPMICRGSTLHSLYSLFMNVPGIEPVKICKGMGFFKQGIVDQHFDARNRLGRLIDALINSEKKMGFGVSENTALLIKNDECSVHGSGGVFIVDCTNVRKTDKRLENIKLTYIEKKDEYYLQSGLAVFDHKQIIEKKVSLSDKNPTATGVLSPYADLKSFICRQLLDNDPEVLSYDPGKNAHYINSYLFDQDLFPENSTFPGFELRFYKYADDSEGYVDENGSYGFKNIEVEILLKQISIK